jgi:hypothetical protein
MAAKNVHVTYRKDVEQWQAKTEGKSKAAGLFDTKKEALDVARDIAKNNHSELVIHDKQNIIRDKDSFGNDPSSIKDKVH